MTDKKEKKNILSFYFFKQMFYIVLWGRELDWARSASLLLCLFIVSMVIISLPQSPLTCCCCCCRSCSVLTLHWRSCWASYGSPERWRHGRCQRYGAARGAYRFVVPGTLPGGGQWSQSRSPLLNTPLHLVHLGNQDIQLSGLLING